jgi:hypothetical protein
MISLAHWHVPLAPVPEPLLAERAGTSGRRSNWDRYVPWAEPEGDPEGTGPPRGPPLDRRLWLGDETNRPGKEAPRMAATIRDRKAKAKINGRNVSHCVRGIKASFTQISRASAGTRAASRLDCETRSPDFRPGLVCDETSGPDRAKNMPTRRACESAQVRTSRSRTDRQAIPRDRLSGEAARCLGMDAPNQVSEAKVRPQMAATIRGREGELIWLRQRYWRRRLRYQVPCRRRASDLTVTA